MTGTFGGLLAAFKLVEVEDADFEWMLRREPEVYRGLRLPPGGVDDPVVLGHVRGITARLLEQGCRDGWMIVDGGEVVGLCGHHEPPEDGVVKIGYSVAASRRLRGYASRAVAAMATQAQAAGERRMIAETALDNVASGRVLAKNGFACTGRRIDPEDGELLVWEKALSRDAPESSV